MKMQKIYHKVAICHLKGVGISYGQQQTDHRCHLLKGILLVDETVVLYLPKKLDVNFPVFNQAVHCIIVLLPKVTGGEPFFSNESKDVLQKARNYLGKIFLYL